MKNIRFTSILWLAGLPILAIIKIFWVLNTISPSEFINQPFPQSWFNGIFPLNLYMGIVLVFTLLYFSYAYINAYIRLQTTYAIPLFLGTFSFITFQAEQLALFIASTLFLLGVFQQFSLREKQQTPFANYNSGLLMGVALIFDIHFLPFILLFAVFLPFSLHRFLQFCFGVLTPLFFIFPALYFTQTVEQWINYFPQIIANLQHLPQLNFNDYSIIVILLIITIIQTHSLYKQYKKNSVRTLIKFLFMYFIFSLLLGVFIYHYTPISILLMTPPMTLLYSLSKHENQTLPILSILALLCYLGINFLI